MNKAALLKELVGDEAYFDIVDSIIKEEMIEAISYYQNPEYVRFELPDDIAKNMTAFFTVLSFYTTESEYAVLVRGLKSETTN